MVFPSIGAAGGLISVAAKPEDAEAAFLSALNAAPHEELKRNVEFYLGVVLYRQDRKDEALTRFVPLLASPARERFSPDLLVWVSETLAEKKKYPEASLAAQLLLDSTTEDDWRQVGWGLLGRSEEARGNKAIAHDAYRKCLETHCINGTKEYIQILLLLNKYSLKQIERAINKALNHRSYGVDTIRHYLLTTEDKSIR